MGTVSISISGDAQIREKLAQLGPELHNMGEAFKDIGTEFAAYYAGEVFASQGSVYGARWEPLAASTLASKVRGSGSRAAGASASQPLVASGKMKSSFRTEGGSDWVRIYNNATNSRGDNYFAFHQLGTSRMPRRMMIGLNDTLKQKAMDKVKADIRRKLGML